MSTPPHEEKYVCTGCGENCGGECEKPFECVAAPLEPSAEQFYEANEIERFDKDFAVYPDGWFKFAEAYAAAVSKNLQEELALTKRVLLQHMNGDDYEMSLAGLYAKLTENDDVGKSPR